MSPWKGIRIGGDAGLPRVEQVARARRRRAAEHLERIRARQTRPTRPGARGGPGTRITAALLAAGATVAGLALAERWLAGAHVEAISVIGAKQLSAAEVALASGIERGATLGTLDVDSVAARLRGNPWIAEAHALPLPSGRVLLGVEERQAAALLVGDPPYAVDASGDPFAPAPEAGLPKLPRLTSPVSRAPGSPDPDLADAITLAAKIEALGLPRPLEIRVAAADDPEGFSLVLPELTPRVILGRGELEPRLRELARILAADVPELSNASRLDLRFRGQAVFAAEPPPEEAAQAAAARGNAPPSKPRPTG